MIKHYLCRRHDQSIKVQESFAPRPAVLNMSSHGMDHRENVPRSRSTCGFVGTATGIELTEKSP